ncbi:ATP-binding protein [Thermococcus argininiproducens]|uniref:ATP-binding protein n=1 Tax=Thermococcus argininiproducens TaxID=2866384 RepID=A0A9E7M8T8_9EURY|nr:ATP-binding protein [Thermococcus argininiproducens]USG99536.1 ATP-binding protein [Thermococcus argininiproducens]
MARGKNPFKLKTLTRRKDLHGEEHKKALEELKDYIFDGEPVLLLGPRRVGKTSLINIAISEHSTELCYLYYDLSPFIGQRNLSVSQLVVTKSNLKLLQEKKGLRISLKVIEGWKERVTPGEYSRELLNVLRALHETCEHGVVVFDEAQVLGFPRGINFMGIFQMIMNSYDNVSIVLTGSMPGILASYLNVSEEEAGFSRFFNEINLSRWNLSTTEKFLKRHIQMSRDELLEVSTELSNVPGFIAMYGNLRWKGITHAEAIEKVREKAIRLWKADIVKFFSVYNSKVYYYVLKALALGPPIGLRYSELLESTRFIASNDNIIISDSSFKRALSRLKGAGLIEETETRRYIIPELPLRKAILKIGGI